MARFVWTDSKFEEVNNRLDSIESKVDKVLGILEGTTKNPVSTGKGSSNKKNEVNTTKTEGKVVNATKNTIKIEVVDGVGKGEGKQFIKLIFSGKPSEKIRNEMKLHGFRYFKMDNTWSAFKTDKNMTFAKSLIK